MSHPAAERIVGLYDEKADGWILDRARTLGRGGPGVDEAGWIARFIATLPPSGRVLDVGCGSGWPIAAHLLERGFSVTGIDASPRLIAHARQTLPMGDWRVADMRTLALDETFDGIIAWFSLFHLSPNDQRIALGRILGHGAEGAMVMFQAGPHAGESIGQWRGEPLYHSSLDQAEYDALVRAAGWVPERVAPEDFEGLGVPVMLARRAFLSAE